jgi:glucuronosyltransferase
VLEFAMKVLTFLVALSAVSITNGANILYLSNAASPSHFVWCKNILNELHQRGHNITALSGDIEESKANLTYLHLEQLYPTINDGPNEPDYFKLGSLSPLETFQFYAKYSEQACIGAVKSRGYKNLLEYSDKFKFDLVINDFTMGPCMLAFVDKFGNPPLVGVSPFNELSRLARISGAITYPSFVPAHDLMYTQRMSFLERIVSTITHAMFIMSFKYFIVPSNDKIIRPLHPNAPYLEDIESKIGLYLINNNPLFDYQEPVFSNVRLVGGAQIKEPKQLPDDLKTFADSAEKGLVLFSLGTNVRSDKLGTEIFLKILRAFFRLPQYNFLWKFETKEAFRDLPPNVMIQTWIPQNDVLAHKNTKLFMAHCGLLGIQEAMWYGVPILGFPVFADQPQNAFRLVELGVAEQMSIVNFTETELYENIKNMLENPKYQKKVKSISTAFKDRLQTPLEESVYWIEWFLRHPKADLQGPSSELNIFVRHSIDVYITLFLGLALFLYLTLKFFIFLIKFVCCCGKKVQTEKKKKTN